VNVIGPARYQVAQDDPIPLTLDVTRLDLSRTREIAPH
jgi:hypothetical protein